MGKLLKTFSSEYSVYTAISASRSRLCITMKGIVLLAVLAFAATLCSGQPVAGDPAAQVAGQVANQVAPGVPGVPGVGVAPVPQFGQPSYFYNPMQMWNNPFMMYAMFSGDLFW